MKFVILCSYSWFLKVIKPTSGSAGRALGSNSLARIVGTLNKSCLAYLSDALLGMRVEMLLCN